jgi:hypothetical protein
MNGLALAIESGNTGGSKNYYFLFSFISKIFDKRGFTGTGFTGEEKVLGGIFK